MVAPSGEQFEIRGGGHRAVVTECGAGLRLLAHDEGALVDGFGADEMASSGRGQLLLPWPNRVRDGRYTFEGRELQLPLSEPARANASHGLTRWTAWTLEEQSPHSVSLTYRLMAQTGYPWTVDLHASYDISADGLTVTVTATNLSDSPAPFAQGAHPYLTVGTDPASGPGGIDGWELLLPAGTAMLVDERKNPAGTEPVDGTSLDFRVSRPLRGVQLDTAFTDLERGPDGRVEVQLRNRAADRGVALWADARHRWLQVYTGDDLPADRARTSVAVEPMTSPPNAFASGEDLVVLAPAGEDGCEHSSSWGIRAL